MIFNGIVNGASASRLNMSPTEAVFNDDSIDLDFRVESNGQANMLFVDGGNDAVLFATTTNGTTANGTVIRAAGEVLMTRTDAQPLLVNRAGNAGAIIEFRNANSAVGVVGGSGSRLHIASQGNSGIRFRDDLNCITPCNADGSNSDNDQNLGQASVRYGTIFATNASINTSDRNEKQDIEELTDAEKRVAVVAKGLMRKYRWKSAVAEKGDKARTHFGIIAQDLQDAFTAESLDASKYAMFCSDTWWEKEISVDAVEADEANGIEAKDAYTYMDDKQEATTGYTKKTRLGVRYSELLAFIISAI
jgi:prepilin-type processing-associated H-X9-DG protein